MVEEEISKENIVVIEKALEQIAEKEETKEVETIKIDSKGRVKRSPEEEKKKRLETWIPKTRLGKLVRDGEIISLDQIKEKNLSILEPEVIDILMPGLEEKLIGFNKTTKVTRSGRNFSFRATVLVGDKREYVAIGTGKDKERFPALRKATRNAKLNLIKVKHGCGSWECTCNANHSIPFKVEGKAGSLRVTLIPAPKGVGLAAGDAIKPILELAGVRDVWSYTKGRSKTTLNFMKATVDALNNTNKMKSMEKK